ncbi:uncharacterized protein F4822DRAFT_59810 [Hypoxylon trugodes]|uniref:uncharacterized protein n=1 Tax=Hypoxylon trugodes TaxID=326681 RepID=UPI002191E051|nr:uncharacterized protein F4822DRAFT_59810 [Hypoxylon trugodes]KAI1384064.1 hypothetical protein F4822DRAFT_59810 [Hypoxylon trugodes]
MGKYRGNRSILFRQKPPQKYVSPKNCWNGPFRFFDLPAELRDQILKLVILESDSTKYTVRLFLTCQSIYAEAATIFYEEVYLDNMRLKGTVDPFLAGQLTRVAPRQYVRNLTIRFPMNEHISLFGGTYGTALREMVEEGRLQNLRLEVGSRFPCYEFWGLEEDDMFTYGNVRLPDQRGGWTVASMPLLVTREPFQTFLKFLEEFRGVKASLYIDARDHLKFWCPFHRLPPSPKECGGDWRGSAAALKIQCSVLVRVFKGAHPVGPTPNKC